METDRSRGGSPEFNDECLNSLPKRGQVVVLVGQVSGNSNKHDLIDAANIMVHLMSIVDRQTRDKIKFKREKILTQAFRDYYRLTYTKRRGLFEKYLDNIEAWSSKLAPHVRQSLGKDFVRSQKSPGYVGQSVELDNAQVADFSVYLMDAIAARLYASKEMDKQSILNDALLRYTQDNPQQGSVFDFFLQSRMACQARPSNLPVSAQNVEDVDEFCLATCCR